MNEVMEEIIEKWKDNVSKAATEAAENWGDVSDVEDGIKALERQNAAMTASRDFYRDEYLEASTRAERLAGDMRHLEQAKRNDIEAGIEDALREKSFITEKELESRLASQRSYFQRLRVQVMELIPGAVKAQAQPAAPDYSGLLAQVRELVAQWKARGELINALEPMLARERELRSLGEEDLKLRLDEIIRMGEDRERLERHSKAMVTDLSLAKGKIKELEAEIVKLNVLLYKEA